MVCLMSSDHVLALWKTVSCPKSSMSAGHDGAKLRNANATSMMSPMDPAFGFCGNLLRLSPMVLTAFWYTKLLGSCCTA